MSITVTGIAFCVIVLVIVLRVTTTRWDVDDLWKRQEAKLKEQGIVAQRPDDWDVRVSKQRMQMMYIVLAALLLLSLWFVASVYIYS